uniref:Hypothetical lipoprotein transmembrane n=1 Tax=Spiroplasma citri TaxID=2133 RepID=Q14N26_SPICI|nr:hypothetical lipoprotein transmembrane [Spiroplasma citri]
MKRLLSIIGAITLVGTSTTSLIACNTAQEYTPEELKELKEKNKIDTADENIKNNLEWIAPQEKPFNEVDNKYYFVVWRGDENDNWRIVKFKNDSQNTKKIDNINDYSLIFHWWDKPKVHHYDLTVSGIRGHAEHIWGENSGINYFKAVYRWNLDTQEPDLILDDNGNVKVKRE